MKYLLDTNTCIRYLNGRSPSIIATIDSLEEGSAAVCSVVKAELFFGALRSHNPPKNLADQRRFLALFPSLSFDDAAAEHYGQIRADLATKGTLIGANDLLIASIALANNLTLVTHNTSEFGRVAGLEIEDWEIE